MSVTLSAGVRQNLLSLQSTADLLSQTQNRLATGLKVSSALDNPNSYFTASSLNARASDLGNLLDDQSQAIQVVKAANQGITAISSLVDSAKAKANQALATSDSTTRATYAQQYTDILSQIQTLAKDSGYNGKNLLGGTGNDLTVVFNEHNTSTLKISAVDYTSTTNLGLDTAVNSAVSTTAFTAGTTDTASAGVSASTNTLKIQLSGNSTTAYNISLATTDSIKDVINKVNAQTNGAVQASYDTATGNITYTAADSRNNLSVTENDNTNAAVAGSKLTAAQPASTTNIDFSNNSQINAVLSALNSAQNSLRAQSSTFGTNLSTVQVRQDFTNNLINTLKTGADKLTLADSNTEGANLLALQTQQQLSSTALSLASRSDQNVLRLIGG